jgi:hypothetical protein
LLSVLPHDRGGRFEADTHGSTLVVDKGALGGNPPDDIFRGQYRCHPATTLKTQPGPVLTYITKVDDLVCSVGYYYYHHE